MSVTTYLVAISSLSHNLIPYENLPYGANALNGR